MTNFKSVLSEHEEECIISQLAKGQGEFTEDDAFAVWQWASKVKIDGALLESVIEGKLALLVVKNKIKFKVL